MTNTTTTTPAQGIARMPEVMRMIGLSKPSIYRMIAAGKFPGSVPLGLAAKGWMRSEVEAWIAQRVSERDAECATADAAWRPERIEPCCVMGSGVPRR